MMNHSLLEAEKRSKYLKMDIITGLIMASCNLLDLCTKCIGKFVYFFSFHLIFDLNWNQTNIPRQTSPFSISILNNHIVSPGKLISAAANEVQGVKGWTV